MERDTVEVVARHALFRRLPQDHKALLLRQMVEEQVSSNTLIFQEGTPGDSLYIVVSGTVLLQRDIDDDPVPLVQLQKGESFGELATINPGNRLLTAKAIDSGSLVRLSHDALDELKTKSPDAALAIRSKILDHFLIKIRNLQPIWEQLLTQCAQQLGGDVLGRGR